MSESNIVEIENSNNKSIIIDNNANIGIGKIPNKELDVVGSVEISDDLFVNNIYACNIVPITQDNNLGNENNKWNKIFIQDQIFE